MGAIRAAKNTANEITPQGIKELTGLVIPPGGVCDVLAATLWLLGEFPDLTPPPSKKKKKTKVNVEEAIWGTARKVMGRADFRRKLQNIDVEQILTVKPDTLSRIDEYTNKDHFEPERIRMK